MGKEKLVIASEVIKRINETFDKTPGLKDRRRVSVVKYEETDRDGYAGAVKLHRLDRTPPQERTLIYQVHFVDMEPVDNDPDSE